MAKQLVFSYQGEESAFGIQKVDRKKLYGYKESEVLDEAGQSCEFAVLAEDGSTVIGAGDVGMGYLTADGHWTSKSELRPVDINGDEIQPVKSSFDKSISLEQAIDVDSFFRHNIRLVYQLEATAFSSKLKEALVGQTIFTFPYSYRGGLQADRGFLLQGADGNFFLLVGDEMDVEFIGLRNVAATVSDEDDSVEESDFMDFDMI